MLCSIAAGLAVNGWLISQAAWGTLAIAAAVISLVALALFWNAFPTLIPTKVGAIALDVITLVCLLWANWPTQADIGG